MQITNILVTTHILVHVKRCIQVKVTVHAYIDQMSYPGGKRQNRHKSRQLESLRVAFSKKNLPVDWQPKEEQNGFNLMKRITQILAKIYQKSI